MSVDKVLRRIFGPKRQSDRERGKIKSLEETA
jgi:hypothetical protein